MRIVQLANFWTPTSGGLRVVLDHLAAGYAARGHRVRQIVPGSHDGHEVTGWGRRTTVASPVLPGTGYRMVVRLRHVDRLLIAFRPDVIEVSDRATLAHLATRWSGRGVRVVLVAHERLDHIVSAGGYGSAFDVSVVRRLSDSWNPRCGDRVDDVVVPSRFAAAEWHRVGVRPVVVPWGVDLDRFQPRPEPPRPDRLRLVWAGRLAAEKRPELALDALAALHALDVPAELVLVGDGPRRDRLAQDAARRDLDVVMLGHVHDPAMLARALGTSSVALATSGIETFGLVVLEAMACGTPVVACAGGAAGEVAGPAGRVVAADGTALAAGALALWTDPTARTTARARAEQFGWDAAIDAMLRCHRHDRAAA